MVQSYHVGVERVAQKAMLKLPRQTAARLLAAIEALAE